MERRTIHSKYLLKNYKIPKNYEPPIIVGFQIKTPENIGSIIRLADNMGCEKVIFIGDKDEVRNSKIKKTASSSYSSVNWKFIRESELKTEIPSDYKWIAIETSSDSKNIYKTNFPEKVVLIVGNEIQGINSKLLDQCYSIIHIPLLGNNKSMNVSHALSVVLFEWFRQIIA